MWLKVLVFALLSPVLLPAAIITQAGHFSDGLSSQTVGGLLWISSPGTFQKKSVAGYTGVGIIGGATDSEIDIGEFLTATAIASPIRVRSFTLGLLFDGPEFNDVEEVAVVKITSLSLGTLSYTLTNTYQPLPSGPDLAIWSGLGSVLNLSPSTSDGAAVWRVMNPFGNISDIVKIQFTAMAGLCGSGPCTNQSDFTFNQLEYEQVPEPSPAILIALGLVGLALWYRLRRSSRSVF